MTTRMSMRRRLVAITLGLALAVQGAPGLAWAQTARSGSAPAESTGQQVAYGAGSVLSTLVYSPLKASFCILGAIGSGFAFPVAGSKTAGNIASSACGGTWAITPDTLRGKEEVHFIGNRTS